MTLKQAKEIAKANAVAAIDQELGYESIDASITAYAKNVVDTLSDQGLQNYVKQARTTYYAHVARLLPLA